MKPWALLAVVVAAAFGVLLWHDHATDAESISWTDPKQPPPMVAPAVGSSTGRVQSPEPYARTYPGSLEGWSGCVIGNC